MANKKQPVKKRVAKKQPVKKRVAKKQTFKKRVAKKQPVKKRVAKKQPVKKRVAKKQPVKKKVAKKQPVKKQNATLGITIIDAKDLKKVKLQKGSGFFNFIKSALGIKKPTDESTEESTDELIKDTNYNNGNNGNNENKIIKKINKNIEVGSQKIIYHKATEMHEYDKKMKQLYHEHDSKNIQNIERTVKKQKSKKIKIQMNK